MSYAGACGGPRPGGRILFFHTISFDNITDFRDAAGTCGTATKTGNTPPTVYAGPDYTIPRGTAFKLTAAGADTDGDVVTYSWEQVDLAPLCALPPYDGFGPLYFSDVPTLNPSRTFQPEATVDRTFTFRCTVRDNRAGAGGVNYDTMVLTAAGDPFAVTFPNGGELVPSGCPLSVAWTVGGGSVAKNVNILLSTDGGRSFPTVLAANTPNDGIQAVEMPCIALEAECQVRVEAVGNVFFDDSDGNFALVGEGPHIASRSGFEDAQVNSECVALVPFAIVFEDDCAMDDADVSVQAFSTDATAVVQDLVKTQLDVNHVQVTGNVRVSDLTACPAAVRAVIVAQDLCGFSSAFGPTFEVTDPIAPRIAVTLSRDFLWPPNHALVDIRAEVNASDNCPGVSWVLSSIVSDEPRDGLGDGDTSPDVVGASFGTADLEFQLRSERSGKADGRTYTITYTATDGCGNRTPALAYVRVAHDQAGHALVAFGMSDDGTGIDPDANSVVFVVPSQAAESGVIDTGRPATQVRTADGESPNGTRAAFDAVRIAAKSLAAGNTATFVPVLDEKTMDANGDGLVDRVLLFPAATLAAALAKSAEAGVQLGLHYAMPDGDSFLVPDIRGIPRAGSLARGILERLGTLGTVEGTSVAGGLVTSPGDDPPAITMLSGVQPNPFAGSTTVGFDLARAAHVRLAIYDPLGRLVTVLEDGERPAGRHTLVWDGRDVVGRRVRTGMYFLRFDGDGITATRKAVFMQ
jgi:hypothetical protein